MPGRLPTRVLVTVLMALSLAVNASDSHADEASLRLSPSNEPAAVMPIAGMAGDGVPQSGAHTDLRPLRIGQQQAIWKVASALAVVLGGFWIFGAWSQRRSTRSAAGSGRALEMLETIPLNAQIKLHLVRCGQRLLVLYASPNAVERVSEISDPAEVAAMLAGDHDTLQSIHDGQSPTQVNSRVSDLLQAIDSHPHPNRREPLAAGRGSR